MTTRVRWVAIGGGLVAVLVVATLLSAFSIREQGRTVTYLYYPDGNVKSETPYNSDSLIDGPVKSYSPDGTISHVAHWTSGTFQGSDTYDRDGKLMHSVRMGFDGSWIHKDH